MYNEKSIEAHDIVLIIGYCDLRSICNLVLVICVFVKKMGTGQYIRPPIKLHIWMLEQSTDLSGFDIHVNAAESRI